jgi:polar amino acid transport system substrate-binding protein
MCVKKFTNQQCFKKKGGFKKKGYIAILWLVCGVAQSAVATEVLTVLADEWFPINAKPYSAPEGFGIDFMREIFEKKYQMKVDYQLMPWERSLQRVEKGEADCVLGAYYEDAPNFIFPKEPIIEGRLALFALKEKEIHYSGLDSLLNLQIGLVSGYSYGDEIDQFIEKNKQTKFLQYAVGDAPLQTNLKKLRAKRIDAFIESNIVMTATLKQQQITDQIKRVSFIGKKIPIFLACSPKKESSKRYVQLWDEGMQALKVSGEAAAILAGYGLSLTEHEK